MAVEAQMGGGPNPMEMVAKLEKRLKDNPDDLQGQIMAGRSYMALNRMPEAKKAWEKALELDPKQHEAHFNLGVIQIETRQIDDPEIFKQALAHFDMVLADLPNQPAVNWYRGLALWYLNRRQETDAAWTLAAQNMEPGTKDIEFVKDALIKLRAGEVPF
jgi:cytochrome c-type biogenesis protein CcmH